MLNPATRPAFRRSSQLWSGGTIAATFLTVISLASVTSLASAHGSFHGAAHAPRFGAEAVKNSQTVVVKPNHRSASTLLPAVDHDDIQPRHRLLADQTLRALPAYCREHLRNFYVNYDKKAANRGLGGEDTIIIIGTVPDNEFRALLTHECGHVSDIGGLKGNPGSGPSGFLDGNTPVYASDPSVAFYQISWVANGINQPGTKDGDFVSGYAQTDPFEDFAESFAFYALHKKEFQRLASQNPVLKTKYNFMEQVVFAGSPEIASSKFRRGTRVPWDVTKLPYTWHAKK